MNPDDPVIRHILDRAMVSRIATLSRNGRPSVNPLYFIYIHKKVWLGTPEWTLAVRNVKADPRVSLLFNVEKDPADRRVLRIRGTASIRMDAEALRTYRFRIAQKCVLTPEAIWNMLTHLRQLWLRRYYTAQSSQKGGLSIIEVTPLHVDLLS